MNILFPLLILLYLVSGCKVSARWGASPFAKDYHDGNCPTLCVNDFSFGPWAINDKIWRFTIGANCCVRFYQDADYKGNQAAMCAQDQDETSTLNWWSYRISSLKVYPKSNRCTVQTFDNANASGSSFYYEGKVSMVNGNDAVSSVKFNMKGCCATFYEDDNYKKKLGKKCYKHHNSAGVYNFPSSWNDKLSSMKIDGYPSAEEAVSASNLKSVNSALKEALDALLN